MTRIYEIESDEFFRIEEGKQNFIVLRDDKIGLKTGDVLILQDVPEGDEGPVGELSMRVDFTVYFGLKNGYTLCAIKAPENI